MRSWPENKTLKWVLGASPTSLPLLPNHPSDNPVRVLIDLPRLRPHEESPVLIEYLSIDHRQLHVLLAAAVDQILHRMIHWLHIRLLQINHDQIR